MPHKDPEERKKQQRIYARDRRKDKKIEKLTGKSVDKTTTPARPSAPAKPSVSASSVDLKALAETIRVESGGLKLEGWLNLCGSFGLQMVALAQKAMLELPVTSRKEALHLHQYAKGLIDEVIAATGQLGSDEVKASEIHTNHKQLLSQPGAIEAAQQLTLIRSQIMRQKEN